MAINTEEDCVYKLSFVHPCLNTIYKQHQNEEKHSY